MRIHHFLWLLSTTLFVFSACKKEEESTCRNAIDNLKINQIQVIASHNSYRLATTPSIYNLLIAFSSALPAEANPIELDYTHLPLEQQFSDYGVRSIELDIYYDPLGGQFYERTGNELVGLPPESNIPALQQPGFKVIHLPDIDYNTHHYTFIDALQTVKNWSDSHPSHLPISIYVEVKTSTIDGQTSIHHWTPPVPFDEAGADALDLEIDAVFGENSDQIITPDDVRGSYATLEAAVLDGNWPTIGEARGKVMFIISGATGIYKTGHPSLADRRCFIFSDVGEPETAFLIDNDPRNSVDEIKTNVQNGYIVRTRTDVGTHEARSGDTERREIAMASGAQIISTDYYRADPRADTSAAWSSYSVSFPNGEVARINPINGELVENCTDWESF